MILESMKFCRYKGENNEWCIEGKSADKDSYPPLTFENVNLIVGKNATGKSRTVDAIRYISDLLADEVKLSQLNKIGFGTAEYELVFNDSGKKIWYYLSFKNGEVIQEILKIEGIERVNRVEEKLWYEGANGYLDFVTDVDILAITKRDKKQHSFFEKLFEWGKNLNHFRFGTPLGKNTLLKDISTVINDDYEISLKDGNEVAAIFLKGMNKFSEDFEKKIIDDMALLNYAIKKVNTNKLLNLPFSAYGMNVQESDNSDITGQHEMSQGMFRALSLIIQLNYSLLSDTSSCILIDDIGEGLDYERSKNLIDLIINKVEGTEVQVIMTTNDRFVMNKIPLKYWSVIQRLSQKSIFYNYRNSKKNFDDYRFTGLNNFDFLTSEFFITGFETEEIK